MDRRGCTYAPRTGRRAGYHADTPCCSRPRLRSWLRRLRQSRWTKKKMMMSRSRPGLPSRSSRPALLLWSRKRTTRPHPRRSRWRRPNRPRSRRLPNRRRLESSSRRFRRRRSHCRVPHRPSRSHLRPPRRLPRHRRPRRLSRPLRRRPLRRRRRPSQNQQLRPRRRRAHLPRFPALRRPALRQCRSLRRDLRGLASAPTPARASPFVEPSGGRPAGYGSSGMISQKMR
jgi:hypothetical protein